jgi:hypothetical protein
VKKLGVTALLLLAASVPALPQARNPVSDDFNSASLNTSLWTFVNPVGNGSYSLDGSHVLLTVPAGSNHDPIFGGVDNSARIVQPIGNVDFSVEAKFDSVASRQYQFEGILVEQDAANFLRFQAGSNGSSIVVNASKIIGSTEIVAAGGPVSIPSGATSIWLRVQRSGTTWTENWSTDGLSWNFVGSFSQTLAPVDLGLFSGNYNPTPSAAPAFTASVDHFHTVHPPTPDDFNGAALNTTLWTFVNPLGDGSYFLTGSELALNLPGGPNHDPAFGGSDNAVRIVQTIGNQDFTVEAKFDSLPSQQYQFEGIVVEQDAANYLRFQIGSTGSSLVVNVSEILSGAQTTLGGGPVSIPAGTTSLWLRIAKSGNVWVESWSTDGSTYNFAANFWQALAIGDIGIFAGNYSNQTNSAPAFSTRIDSFSVIRVPTPLLHFSAITATGETASFTLDTSVPNSFVPGKYLIPNPSGVYPNAVHDLTFEGTTIPVADLLTTVAQTGDSANPNLTEIDVGPLFNSESLSLTLYFRNPLLVAPLQSDPSVYQTTFDAPRSVLFPQTPPPRPGVILINSLSVTVQH